MRHVYGNDAKNLDIANSLNNLGNLYYSLGKYEEASSNYEEALALAEAIRSVKQNVRYCSRCFNLAEGELCEICQDSRRTPEILCVVEQPRDLIALEATGSYRGVCFSTHLTPQ